MTSACQLVSIEPLLLAVVEAELNRRDIASNIRTMFDVAYAWLKNAGVQQAGHNYALYDKGVARELVVRVGFPVSGPFPDSPSVKCMPLVAGSAARAVHVGPYSDLHRTYAELHSWCRREGLRISSQSWEVYGDWQADPSRLETELYLRLA
jgi:effector-binding domain-containing protein